MNNTLHDWRMGLNEKGAFLEGENRFGEVKRLEEVDLSESLLEPDGYVITPKGTWELGKAYTYHVEQIKPE